MTPTPTPTFTPHPYPYPNPNPNPNPDPDQDGLHNASLRASFVDGNRVWCSRMDDRLQARLQPHAPRLQPYVPRLQPYATVSGAAAWTTGCGAPAFLHVWHMCQPQP